MEINVEVLKTMAIDYGIKVLLAAAIFFIGKWVAGIVTNMMYKLMQKSNMDETLACFLKNIISSLLLAFVVIASINKLGIQTASIVAIVGAAGLAVGLALQGSLSNFAAGVMIILFKPFKVGDFIEAGGTIGSVEEIQIFCTILNHPDNRRIIVPNSSIMGGNISNFTGIDKRRVDLKFGISYADDMAKAKEVLTKICAEDERILKDPAPKIAVVELGDSSVNLICRPYTHPTNYWDVWFDITEKGKLALEEAGCTIPFPQRDVHVYKEDV